MAESKWTEFFVDGTPQQKGSTKSFVNPKWLAAVRKGLIYASSLRQVFTTGANSKAPAWEKAIQHEAWQRFEEPTGDPWLIVMHFIFERPASVKASKRPFHVVKPDVDKLCRCVLDALTGVVYHDDNQVIGSPPFKWYGPKSGVLIKALPVFTDTMFDSPGMMSQIVFDGMTRIGVN